MIKLFVPPLDSVWRLTSDWTPPEAFFKRRDNAETLWAEKSNDIPAWMKATGDHTSDGSAWVGRFHAWQNTQREARGQSQFLAGTVMVFDRYHASHSGQEVITLRILAAPDLRLHPRKLKGQRHGAGRIYFTIAELNSLPELEEVHDPDITGR